MLLTQRALVGIADGSATLAFRRWRRPTVRAGGTLRTAIGVLAIDAVDAVSEADVTEADARRAGFSSRDELLADLRPEGVLYRIELRLAGPDPRIALRERDELTADELAEVERRLSPVDVAALRAIAGGSGVRAAELAGSIGLERDRFKVRVRRLKELGLTESLGTGYRLSPRGRAVLATLG